MDFDQLSGIWADVTALVPPAGSWMMPPADFACGAPGLYKGYRAAGANLLSMASGGIYVAQNAMYASVYDRGSWEDSTIKMWRLGLRLRAPHVTFEKVLRVTPEIRASLPGGTDAIVMPFGDNGVGRGPVIVVLDPACVVSVEETWFQHQVVEAIQRGGADAVPDDVLLDYPDHMARIDRMRLVYPEGEVRWGRF